MRWGDVHAVRFNAVPQPGQWIRRAGEDVTRGAVVLPGAAPDTLPSWAWPPASGWRS
jgi:molybdopterin biosynthesis enzyme